MDAPIGLGRLRARDVCQLHSHVNSKEISEAAKDQVVVALLFLYGSWNTKKHQAPIPIESVQSALKNSMPLSRRGCKHFVGLVQVDETDDTLQTCIGDNDTKFHWSGPCPPEKLPCLAIATQDPGASHTRVVFVTQIKSSHLLCLLKYGNGATIASNSIFSDAVQATIQSVVSPVPPSSTSSPNKLFQADEVDAVRIFVAGDRSNAGKSSVCLGMLGHLLSIGYPPSSLAYIKPATQCESPQLIQAFCEEKGIACVPVGPLVYFKGFTRAFLAGETEPTAQLLRKAGEAVDQVARGKRLVMIDGVGFPAVGSICGTDNAQVALACGYPREGRARKPPGVLLVGISGVGGAVDAYNLNATYFDYSGVHVLGAVFNKLELTGFYSLNNCKKSVTAYFDQQQSERRPFGFLPLFPGIGGERESAMKHVDEFVRIFGEYVDVAAIVEAATRVKPSNSAQQFAGPTNSVFLDSHPAKRAKTSIPRTRLERAKIEQLAEQAGAAPSA